MIREPAHPRIDALPKGIPCGAPDASVAPIPISGCASSEFDREMQSRLEALRAEGLYRVLHEIAGPASRLVTIAGKTLLNFASNDYLGLAADPALKQAATEAAARYGAGATASRLICGSLRPHHELEEALAHFKGTQAAIAFSSGYTAALGTICALVGKSDTLLIDKRVHASIVDATRLSGARIRVFRHNDLSDLERKLRWARAHPIEPGSRILLVTESVFSMDGDLAPLREIISLKSRFGAWLMLDEAHATGLFGTHRRGLAEAADLSDHIEVQMGTLGKAIGAAGGYICGSRQLIDYLLNRARPFIFSTAPVPAAAAAATAGIRLVQSPDGAARCARLWQRITALSRALARSSPHPSAIIPIHIGAELAAVNASDSLRQAGILAPAVRYPSVPRRKARLRITLSAAHTEADVSLLAKALNDIGPRFQNQGDPAPG